MKLIFTVLFTISFAIATIAQTTEQHVIAADGGFFQNSGSSVSWTVGEGMIESYNTGTQILTQGFQQPVDLLVNNFQQINFNIGWNLFSTYIAPNNPNIESILSPIVNDIIIVKDYNGLTYWPEYFLNMIGNVNNGVGYQIKVNQADSFEVVGTILTPETTPISVVQGWSYLGYIRTTAAPLELMLSSINPSIEIMKNQDGNPYWPAFSLNLIGDLEPGKGYQIKMTNAETLYYPANTIAYQKQNLSIPMPEYYSDVVSSDHNMTIGIPQLVWDVEPQEGDEVAVFNSNNELVGAAVFTGKMIAIPVWGDDSMTDDAENMQEGERFTLRIMHQDQMEEEYLNVEYWIEGDDTYKANEIAIVGDIKHSGIFNDDRLLTCKNYPNPFREETTIEFFLPNNDQVQVEILNLLGESMRLVHEGFYERGNHQIIFQSEGFTSGTYLYRVSDSRNTITGYLSIVK